MTGLVRRSFLGLAAVAAFSTGALAQQAGLLEEVVVTAERRELSLQETPISVVAFTTESIEFKGIETIEDISTFTPNLDIKGSRFSGNNNPVWQIRGLSGYGGTTSERTAGLYIDGIYVPRTTGPFLNVLDVERIEILRGPQGTLFGRNSTGGAIRIFTQRPGPERDGYVRVGVGNFDRRDLTAMFNVPVSDAFYLRGQFASLNQDGYVRRGPQLLGGSEDTIGRLQARFVPSENVTVDINFSVTEVDSDGGAQDLAIWDMRPHQDYEGNYADWLSDFLQNAGQPRLEVYNDPRVVLDDYTMPDWCFIDDGDPDWDPACEQWNTLDFQQLDATVEWQINDTLTLTSTTGISSFESAAVNDAQLLGFSWTPSEVNSDVFYQELQLNVGLERVNLVAGFTYFEEEGRSDAQAALSVVGTSNYFIQRAFGNAWSGLRSQNNVLTEPDAEAIGLFLNATVDVTDNFSITPGLRWSLDEKDVTQTEFASDNFVPFEGGSTRINAKEDWDEVDWRLTLDYDIADSHMVYVTASKAFRAGAYSLPSGMGAPGISENFSGEQITADLARSPPFIPPESVENHEIGLRTEWLDGRVRFNVTYFDMFYSDRQGPVAIPDPTTNTGFIIQTVDTGDVDIWGVELDAQFGITDNFALDMAAGNVDYKLHDICGNNGDFLFPGPVEESYSFGGRFNVPMQTGSNLAISLNYAYVGDQETHPGGTQMRCPSPAAQWFFDSRYTNEAYGLWNGRVRYTSSDGRWTGTLFVNNLTDEVYSNNASRAGGGWWDFVVPGVAGGLGVPERSVVQHVRGRPREYGVTFQYNFGDGARAP